MTSTEEEPPPNTNLNPDESPEPQTPAPPVSNENENLISQPPITVTTDPQNLVSDVKEPSPSPAKPVSSPTHEPGPETPVPIPNPSPNTLVPKPSSGSSNGSSQSFTNLPGFAIPVIRGPPPMVPTALQPPIPVPGQYLLNRPPLFTYNPVPNPPGQPFQLSAGARMPVAPNQRAGLSNMPSHTMQPPLQRDPVQPNREFNGDSKKNEEVQAGIFDIWTAHRTETGLVYYYNSLTGKSTYEKPPGFKGEPDKVSAQPVPVSWEKIAGTNWTLVTTNDGKKYYYDNINKVSSWQVPAEVAELLKKQDAEPKKETPEQNPTVTNVPPVSPAVLTGGRDAIPLRQTPTFISPSALDTIKKKLQDASDSNPPQKINVEKSKDGDESEFESESDSETAESGLAKQNCINQFKEMLKERGVRPFAKWDKELPKIIFDPRFKAVPTNEARRMIFDRYVRTRAEEERREKKAAQKAAIEKFKELLEEASEEIDHKTEFREFKKNWGNDLRFKALDRKEAETLLNEKVKAAEEKVQIIRRPIIENFKSMFRESNQINSKSRWNKVKENFRSDPRYKTVKHEERETLFDEYIAELKAAEEEAEQFAKSKLDEQEKLKERERETRKRKEREEQEMERVKMKIRRKDALTSYQALLVEMIKDPMASWKESKPRLERDPQGRLNNPDLPLEDKENLFREHVKDLYDRYEREFHHALTEVINAESASRVTSEGKSILNSWTELKRILKSEPRFAKLVKLPDEFNLIWRRYVEDWTEKNKDLLMEMREQEKQIEIERSASDDAKEIERSKREKERDERDDVKESERSEREKERSERDHKRKVKEKYHERSERDYKENHHERSERDYRRDSKERDYRRDSRERDYKRRDSKEERSDRDYRRDSEYSRRR